MSVPRVKVPLRLDRERTLILSFNAMCKAEEVTGVNFLMGDVVFSSVRVLRALVWAGLLHEDPTLTLEQVGELIQDVGADEIVDTVMKAYAAAMPDAQPEAEEDDADEDPTKA